MPPEWWHSLLSGFASLPRLPLSPELMEFFADAEDDAGAEDDDDGDLDDLFFSLPALSAEDIAAIRDELEQRDGPSWLPWDDTDNTTESTPPDEPL
jgi:hypothetical protein